LSRGNISPFAQMGLRSSDCETPTASLVISFRGYCYGAAEATGAFEVSLGAGNSLTRKMHEDRA
jgi:hypothetical protein